MKLNIIHLIITLILVAYLVFVAIMSKGVTHSVKCKEKYKPEQLDSNCSLDMGASFETRVKKLRYIKHLEK